MAAIDHDRLWIAFLLFDFHTDVGGIGPLATLLASWNKTPGRGDFISNILLYLPLGFVGATAPGRRASLRRLMLSSAVGVVLSISVELLQYYDGGRDTEATDFYANTLGTPLGGRRMVVRAGIPLAVFSRAVGQPGAGAAALPPGSAIVNSLCPGDQPAQILGRAEAGRAVSASDATGAGATDGHLALHLHLGGKIAGPRTGRFYWLSSPVSRWSPEYW